MLVLRLKSAPYWLDLPMGVRLEVLPFGRSLMQEVRDDLATERDTEEPGDADDRADAEAAAPGFDAFCLAVAQRAILGWEGVVEGNGAPAALTPEGVAGLLDTPALWNAFMRDYINPGFGVIAEGNASAPSPTGTSARA